METGPTVKKILIWLGRHKIVAIGFLLVAQLPLMALWFDRSKAAESALSRLAPGTQVVVVGRSWDGKPTIGVGFDDFNTAVEVATGAKGVVISDTLGTPSDDRQVEVRFDRADVTVYPAREMPRSVIVFPKRGQLAPIR